MASRNPTTFGSQRSVARRTRHTAGADWRIGDSAMLTEADARERPRWLTAAALAAAVLEAATPNLVPGDAVRRHRRRRLGRAPDSQIAVR